MDQTWRFVRRFYPEILLCWLALYFTFRELGSFPAAWEDSGLYTMVAKNVAAGHGYSLPILHSRWAYPYFLSVGPTVILPVAFFIHLFGFTLAVARIPSTLYLLGTCVAFYLYVQKISGIRDARWATALLITLSAFINGGKPVLGSVPALFFLLLGLHVLHDNRASAKRAVLMGILFGLSVLTKLTCFLILPALCIAVLYKGVMRQRRTMWYLCLTLVIALALFFPWLLLELREQPGFGSFLMEVFTRSDGESLLMVLANKMPMLLRFQYQYFGVLFVLAIAGFFHSDVRLSPRERVFLVSLFGFFLVYFLMREGWYRHLLLAHVLLLPFVPAGARLLLREYWRPVLVIFIGAQTIWQLDHRGSSQTQGSDAAVEYIRQHLADTDVLIQHPELIVQLPENLHWLYYPLPGNRELMPERFTTRSADELCMLRVRKINEEDVAKYGSAMVNIGGKYFLIPKRSECTEA
ncbi:MAG: hypothetical protein HOO67_07595 [Candidatus Peribacteraceae bacterium]|nr:hypothetical protein [Candidatus Peribacteraceae bacterium]